jgi:predicted transcriptional regulator of viral defense system
VCGLSEGMLRKGSTPLDVALADLARRQWGVVSLAQLRTLGLGSRAVQLRAETGRLRRVHRGVYVVGGAVLPREGRWLAAVMACGPGAVLSHLSGAVHWNLLQYDAPQPHVTAPASRTGAPGIRLHRTRSLDAQDTTTHRGIPTTTVHRTLLDIAADVPTRHLERALAQAERLQLYDHRAIEDVIERSNGHRGTKTLTKAIQDDPQFTRSELEARMHRLARKLGLPKP